MTYEAAVQEIEARGLFPKTLPSIETTKKALERLSLKSQIDPQRVILVAGTNGKGTVSKALQTLLMGRFQKVAFFSSPHLFQTTERINVSNQDISKKDFVEIYLKIKSECSDISLSHFEVLAVMALVYFLNKKSDYMIFEVGLGGTFDATNAIGHYWNVVTHISYDHEHVLGHDLLSIAKNKLGILGHKSALIHGAWPQEIAHDCDSLVESLGLQQKIQALILDHSLSEQLDTALIIDSKSIPLKMIGARSVENFSIAWEAYRQIVPDALPSDIHLLESCLWPGRMQRLQSQDFHCPVFYSGDHNSSGIDSLKSIFSKLNYKRLFLVLSFSKNKNHEEMLEKFKELGPVKIYFSQGSFKPLEQKAYHALDSTSTYCDDPNECLKTCLQEANASDVVLISGSLYLAESFRKYF